MGYSTIEKRKAYQKKWRDANPDKVAEYQARYWARKLKQREQEESTNGGDERGLDG